MEDRNWWQDLYEELQEASTKEEIFRCAQGAAKHLGFSYCCYGTRRPDPTAAAEVIILNSYPNGWMEHYQAAGYLAVDASVSLGVRCSAAMVWSERLFARSGKLWRDANDFGLRVGIAQSCWSSGSTYGLLSLARDADCITDAELRFLQPRIRWLADNAHDRMRALSSRARLPAGDAGQSSDVPDLSAREKEVISWTAEGKTSWEVSRILDISENTVNFHLKRIVAKLGARNKIHAAAKAATLGIMCGNSAIQQVLGEVDCVLQATEVAR